jgi:predicted Zn-dependent protease
MQEAIEQLAALKKPARTLEPGSYRAYLTPMALEEIVDLLGWGGFSLRAQRTGQTPLLRMIEQDLRLHPGITLHENTADGVAPNFQSAGFIRPARIPLIERGKYASALVSPRSALEYDVPGNGAEPSESPLSFDMAAGNLTQNDILAEINTGLYIGNLWYLNYSDLNAARITGMTRFATFWVERGRIQAPVNALRFDETLYNLFGNKLINLTCEREMLLDPGTYGARSSRSARLPGLLVEDMRFTL